MKSIVRKSVVISCALLQSACVVAADLGQLVAAAGAAAGVAGVSGEPRIDVLSDAELELLRARATQQPGAVPLQQRDPIADASQQLDAVLLEDFKKKLVRFVVQAMQTDGITMSQADQYTEAARVAATFAGEGALTARSALHNARKPAFDASYDVIKKINFNDITGVNVKGVFGSKRIYTTVLTPLLEQKKSERFSKQSNNPSVMRVFNLDDKVKQAVIAAIASATHDGRIDPTEVDLDLKDAIKKQAAHVATEAVAEGLIAFNTAAGFNLGPEMIGLLAPQVVAELIAGSQFVVKQVEKSSCWKLCCGELKKGPAEASLVPLKNGAAHVFVQGDTDSQA